MFYSSSLYLLFVLIVYSWLLTWSYLSHCKWFIILSTSSFLWMLIFIFLSFYFLVLLLFHLKILIPCTIMFQIHCFLIYQSSDFKLCQHILYWTNTFILCENLELAMYWAVMSCFCGCVHVALHNHPFNFMGILWFKEFSWSTPSMSAIYSSSVNIVLINITCRVNNWS